MNGEFVLLTEREAMWAEMLAEVLRDHQIPCVSMPVMGFAFSSKTGMPERLKISVPEERLDEACELMEQLFPEEG